MKDLLGDYDDYVEAYDVFTATGSVNTGLSLRQLVTDGRQQQDEEAAEADGGNADREWMLEDFAEICAINPTYEKAMHDMEAHDWSKVLRDDRTFEEAGRFLQQCKESSRDDEEELDHEDVDVHKMTPEQSSVYDEVKKHLLAKKNGSATPPLLKLVTGTAGTGKSFLIKCLRHLLGKSCILIAPTGVAAVNIRGQTMHSAVQLPIGGDASFVDLVGDSLAGLQNRMEGVDYVILDEMSMVGLRNFAMLETRFREAFPQRANQVFGGVSIVMFGDFEQLRPVGDQPLYAQSPKSALQRRGSLAYGAFDSATVLSRVIRQDGDDAFRELLMRVRDGKTTPEDYSLLESRFQGRASNDGEFRDAVHLFSLKEETNTFNLEKLFSLHQPVAQLSAQHTGSRTAKNVKADDAGGLHAFVTLCKGAKVMLNANLWVDKGLCNGTIGTVREIVYRSTKPAADELPVCVLCHFPSYTGPSFLDSESCLFPVTCITRNFDHNGVPSSRTTIPLSLAWAITIHKSQGWTLQKVVLDIGKREFTPGLTFVGMSRVRCLSDLLIHRFDRARLKKLGDMKARLEEDRRLMDMSGVFSGDVNQTRLADIGASSTPVSDVQSTRGRRGMVPEAVAWKDNVHRPSCGDNPKSAESSPCSAMSSEWEQWQESTARLSESLLLLPDPENLKTLLAASSPDFSAIPSAPRGSLLAPRFPSDSAHPLAERFAGTFFFDPLDQRERRALCDFMGIVYQSADSYGPNRTTSVCAYPLKLINVYGDGNCFYRCISRALSGVEDYHLEIRQQLYRFQQGRPDLAPPEPHIPDRIQRAGEWAGIYEMTVMAKMLGVKIQLFCPLLQVPGTNQPRYHWQSYDPDNFAFSATSAISLYACGIDLNRYRPENTTHFALVTHV